MLEVLEALECVCWCWEWKVLRMELTEEEVDLRPRRPAEGRRMEEWGVRVWGLRLERLRCALVRLSCELAVLTRGRAGRVDRVCSSGRAAIPSLRCCCMSMGAVDVRRRSRIASVVFPSCCAFDPG